ncbi:hypothetical protein ANN_17762 [Periplaneta americana]|uniref:DDE-1 domain-containing protein n=1 Tax=Periplaneta americana TaxID=6978 RepID=A0ABQ8SVD9_PERAM|nr:hypothetical protein ANN_17762 [Periplaneta americana]
MDEIQRVYSKLESLFSKFNFPARRIYNVDETEVSTVHTTSRIIASKGTKQVGTIISWERGKNITVCCAVSAAGDYIPPMFIFPRQRMSPQLQCDGPTGALYKCSKNGWMTSELFTVWLEHFAKETSASIDNHFLLIMDIHSNQSHIIVFIFLLERERHPHHFNISYRLQPLDLTFCGPLKSTFNKECETFLKTHAAEKITPYDIAKLFNQAYGRVSSVEKATNGFKRNGIWPLNRNVYSDEDFMAAMNLSPPGEGSVLSLIDDDNQIEGTSQQLV